jgi:hypothetical protein
MTSATEEPGEILSRDAQGRVLVSRERRESLLEEYDRSGMSGVKFARYVGIKYSTLAYWLQSRHRHREPEDFFVGRLLRHAQGLQRSVRAGEQRFWRGSSQRSAQRLL